MKRRSFLEILGYGIAGLTVLEHKDPPRHKVIISEYDKLYGRGYFDRDGMQLVEYDDDFVFDIGFVRGESKFINPEDLDAVELSDKTMQQIVEENQYADL